MVSWAQFSERHCNVRFFSKSVTVREHLACEEKLINVMGNDKLGNNFWTLKLFGHFFGRHLSLALDFGLDRIWEMSKYYINSANALTRLSGVHEDLLPACAEQCSSWAGPWAGLPMGLGWSDICMKRMGLGWAWAFILKLYEQCGREIIYVKSNFIVLFNTGEWTSSFNHNWYKWTRIILPSIKLA